MRQGFVKKAKFYQIAQHLVSMADYLRLPIAMTFWIRATSRAAITAVLVFPNAPAVAADKCLVTSGPQRTAVLELYTSEGCDSCPPADNWVRGLPARKLAPSRVIPLAFHVDYWNNTGWIDSYAQARFSERQRWHSRRRGASFVFTPQILLNGQDYRRAPLFDDIASRVETINQTKPQAEIRLHLKRNDPRLDSEVEVAVRGDAGQRQAETYLALYENNLENTVNSGENKGLTLSHDFVVRELVGPLTLDDKGKLRHVKSFDLDPRWKLQDINLAVFVQHPRNGDILQALSASCH